MSIVAAARGALMAKSIEPTKALLEEITSNNYHRSSESTSLKRSGGKYDVDTVHLLASKVDELTQWFDRLSTPILGTSSNIICEV